MTIAWRAGLVAGTLGMIAGLIEAAAIVHNALRLGLTSRFYLLATSTYGVAFLAAGFLCGWVAATAFRKANDFALPVAAGVTTTLFGFGFATINVEYLPAFDAPISLVADLLLLVATLAVGLFLYRLLLRLPWRPRLYLPCFGTAALVALIATILGFTNNASDDVTGIAVDKAREDLPNILFILVDTLRADHLGVYGYRYPTSPWLDELAAGGIVFENATAAASHTKPSTASIFTSRYPPAHQARRLEEALPQSSITLAQALRAAGYRTAGFSANGFVSRAFGFSKGFEHFQDRNRTNLTLLNVIHVTHRVQGELKRRLPGSHRPLKALLVGLARFERWLLAQPDPIERDQIDTRVTDWLRETRPDPFFIYAHFIDPHAPYAPPDDVLERFEKLHGGRIESPEPPAYDGGLLPFFPGPSIPDEELRGMLARYDAEIAATDDVLRRMTERIRGDSNDRELMVIFASDHGEEFFDHNGWTHARSLFSEVLHVPLVIAGGPLPEREQALRIDTPISMIDLAPTLLDLLGLPAVDAFQGRSLLPAMMELDAPPLEARPIFAEMYFQDWSYARSLSTGGLKVIETRSGDETHLHLFDLQDDPLEQNNLASSVDERELARLQEQLRTVFEESRSTASASTHSIDLDDEMIDQFRALGYVN